LHTDPDIAPIIAQRAVAAAAANVLGSAGPAEFGDSSTTEYIDNTSGPTVEELRKYIIDILQQSGSSNRKMVNISPDDIGILSDITRLTDILRTLRLQYPDTAKTVHPYFTMPRWYKHIIIEELKPTPDELRKMYTTHNDSEVDNLYAKLAK
jgi:hypothetical protein